jgi:putative transposase
MSRETRRAMIAPAPTGLSLSRQCALIGISRSSLYYRPRGDSPENLALMRRIDELFLKYPFYGSRQMARHLGREGWSAGRQGG